MDQYYKENNYYLKRDETNLEKIRIICSELPSFVREFIVGIQLRTSTLTRLNYVYDLRIFFDYLEKNVVRNKKITEISLSDLETLSAFDIELYLDYLSSYNYGGKHYVCGESGKERKLSSLRSFFKYFFNKDKLSSNVCSKVDLPKIHEKPIVKLETNEVAELLDRVDSEHLSGVSVREDSYHYITKDRDVAIITLFLGTGIRISELVGLNFEDFDFNSNSFTVTRKGGNRTTLYFSDEIAVAIKNYCAYLEQQISDQTEFGKKIENQSALFYSIQGKRISVRAVENLVKKYSKHISPLKKITPHKLRSTFGTELYRNTQDIYVVAAVLGHKDINTTRRHYAATSEEIKRKAAKSVKLREED